MREDLDNWLFSTVLPHWLGEAVDRKAGTFVECLDGRGRAMPEVPRRGRVAPRQLFTFARAVRLGWSDPRVWPVLEAGAKTLLDSRTEARGFPSLFDQKGRAVETAGVLYDHAFVLLAGAELHAVGVEDGAALMAAASELIAERFADPAGGYHKVMDEPGPKLANPHMHLLEASLLHFAVSGEPVALDRVREIVGLAREHMVRDGLIAEEMAADFGLSDDNWTEPGHCYEWAFLLHEAATLLGDEALKSEARALFERSEEFVEEDGLVVDRVGGEASYRLWPQLERLRCLQTFGKQDAIDPLLSTLQTHYLGQGPEAGWVDKLDADREPVGTRVPASMLYHLMTALPTVTGRAV